MDLSHAPVDIMQAIGKEFQIKNDEYGPPTIYLSAGISKYTLSNGKECWSMDSKQYVEAAIGKVQKLLAEEGRELKTSKATGKTHGVLNPNYQPELDATQECNAEHAS